MCNGDGSEKIGVLFKKSNETNTKTSKNKLNTWETINGMLVYNIPYKSWMTNESWNNFMHEIIWKEKEKNIIIFDEAAAHMNPEAVRYLEKAGFIPIITPPETSSYVQPNDQLPNCFVQKEVRNKIVDYINKNAKSHDGTIYNPTFNDMCGFIRNALEKLPASQIEASFRRCGVTSESPNEYHDSLKDLVLKTEVTVDENSQIVTDSALERTQKVRRRGSRGHTDEKLKFECPYCMKQYAYIHSPAAKKHKDHCSIRNEIDNIIIKEKHEVNKDAFINEKNISKSELNSDSYDADDPEPMDEDTDQFENGSSAAQFLKSSVKFPKTNLILPTPAINDKTCPQKQNCNLIKKFKSFVKKDHEIKKIEKIKTNKFKTKIKKYFNGKENKTDSSDEVELLEHKLGNSKLFAYFNDKTSSVTPFPPLSTKITECDARRSVRIIDLLGHQISKNLCKWFKENSFTVYNDIHDNLQLPSSCGYIAAKSLYLMHKSASEWETVDIVSHVIGNNGKNLIKNCNILLKKEIYKTHWLNGTEILDLISLFGKNDNSPENCLGYYIMNSRSPVPFDIFLPQIVETIENANRGIGTSGVQYYISNTTNFGQQGFHWIIIALHIKN